MADLRDVVAVRHAAAELVRHVLGEATTTTARWPEPETHLARDRVMVDMDFVHAVGASVGSRDGRIGVVLLRSRGVGILLLDVLVTMVGVMVLVLHCGVFRTNELARLVLLCAPLSRHQRVNGLACPFGCCCQE